MQGKISKEITSDFSNEDIRKININARLYPSYEYIIILKNTKGISSEMLSALDSRVEIRVMGGKKEICNKDDVTYSKEELILIIKEMEKIEDTINKNWSQIQKSMYIYDILKRKMTYTYFTPKTRKDVTGKEARTLRGLISGKNVCAGYSMVFKEMMDRQGIECDYVSGKTKDGGGHAWNLLHINGKIFPVDLTWDAREYRDGNKQADHFANVDSFITEHKPNESARVQNYQKNLCGLTDECKEQVRKTFDGERDFKTKTFNLKRNDGTICRISCIGQADIEGCTLYRYLYSDIDKNGNASMPSILYSHNNLIYFIDREKRDMVKDLPTNSNAWKNAYKNGLFSKSYIEECINSSNGYLGEIFLDDRGNFSITKPLSSKSIDRLPGVLNGFERDNGSKFIVSESPRKIIINGSDLYKYQVFEFDNNNGSVYANNVISEMDFSPNNPQTKDKGFASVFLSRERIHKESSRVSGYIGYYVPIEHSIYKKTGLARELEKEEIVDFDSSDIIKPKSSIIKEKWNIKSVKNGILNSNVTYSEYKETTDDFRNREKRKQDRCQRM